MAGKTEKMKLFERLLSSPNDYPLPPLSIKKIEKTYYDQKPRKQSIRMVFHVDHPKDVFIRQQHASAERNKEISNRKNSRKMEYVKLPTLKRAKFSALGAIKVSPHLIGLYKRAEERQKEREAQKVRRVPIRKKRSKRKIVTPEVIEQEDETEIVQVIEVKVCLWF